MSRLWSRLVRPSALGGATALAAGAVLLVGVPAASAAPAGPDCTASVGLVTCVYGYTGVAGTFTVPAGVDRVTVVATGAAGGGSSPTSGRGATVTGGVGVSAGDTLYVLVGGAGGPRVTNAVTTVGAAGGFNGGGDGGGTSSADGRSNGAGGGGASDVRTSAPGQSDTLDSRLVVAAGGGGVGGGSTGGGDAGAAGGVYEGFDPPYVVPARPGSQTAGGSRGDLAIGGPGTYPGADGTLGGGGAGYGGAPYTNGGGGGGGGLYGGGGGGADLGGAGGSSLVPTGGSYALSTEAAGVVISYVPAPPSAPTGVTTTAADGSVLVGWTAGTSVDEVAPVTGTTATASPGGASCTSTGSSCTISGLTNGTEYSISVVSTSAGQDSAATAGGPVVPFGAVGAPGTPTVTPVSGGLSIAFTPADGNGRPVTGYRATVTDLTDGSTTTVTGTASPLLAEGLAPGRRYRVTVVAVTGAGVGTAASPAVEAVVPVAVPGPQPVADPGAPTSAPSTPSTPSTPTAPSASAVPARALATTGSPVLDLAGAAALLVAGGALTLVAGRRRAAR